MTVDRGDPTCHRLSSYVIARGDLSDDERTKMLAVIAEFEFEMDTSGQLADRIEAAISLIDDPAVVFAPDTPNLNAWPQPAVRREFAEWLAARIEER